MAHDGKQPDHQTIATLLRGQQMTCPQAAEAIGWDKRRTDRALQNAIRFQLVDRLGQSPENGNLQLYGAIGTPEQPCCELQVAWPMPVPYPPIGARDKPRVFKHVH